MSTKLRVASLDAAHTPRSTVAVAPSGLEELIGATPTSFLQPYCFFVSWQGVLTLAHRRADACQLYIRSALAPPPWDHACSWCTGGRNGTCPETPSTSFHDAPSTSARSGFPKALVDLKGALVANCAALPPESPGSKWPKTTLGALRDGVRLTPEQLQQLNAICKCVHNVDRIHDLLCAGAAQRRLQVEASVSVVQANPVQPPCANQPRRACMHAFCCHDVAICVKTPHSVQHPRVLWHEPFLRHHCMIGCREESAAFVETDRVKDALRVCVRCLQVQHAWCAACLLLIWTRRLCCLRTITSRSALFLIQRVCRSVASTSCIAYCSLSFCKSEI